MSVQSKAFSALTLAFAAAALRSRYWKARADAASDADIAATTGAQLEYLLQADTSDESSHVALFITEARTPPSGDRRWFWWVAATCRRPTCRQVHDPLEGWEPTSRHARQTVNEAIEHLTHPDCCPDLDLYDEDEDGDTASP